jgi:hypothetical protein
MPNGHRKKAGKEIMELFIQAVHKYNALEKVPVKISAKHDLYHSERHLIDRIGYHPGVNITEFARSSRMGPIAFPAIPCTSAWS